MAQIKAIKGTQDTLPAESYKIKYLESVAMQVAKNCGFREIRTPVFEYTELFQRGVGDTTDVVQKEMYTFEDKGGRSITLRPEGTAGAIRSFIEHGLFNEPLPQKLCYLTSCYRYEKPQAGRLREFHQFGVECVGTASPAADAEVISIANEIFGFLGIGSLRLELNSIGCPECRAKYREALKSYFEGYKDKLCETCLGRLDKNPMRILDCKSPVCSAIAAEAPKMLEYLCDDCKVHFESVQKYLDAMGVDYVLNPSIVRGLDYYTRTVFEFVSTEIGAQGTVCGGGRYDGLVSELGGADTPALGFAIGLERLLLLMDAKGLPYQQEEPCELFIASMGEQSNLKAARFASSLRSEGFQVQFDIAGRSVKAQMKLANKLGAKFTLVIGDSELESGDVKLKNMENGEVTEMKLDSFEDDFAKIAIQQALDGLDGFLTDDIL